MRARTHLWGERPEMPPQAFSTSFGHSLERKKNSREELSKYKMTSREAEQS